MRIEIGTFEQKIYYIRVHIPRQPRYKTLYCVPRQPRYKTISFSTEKYMYVPQIKDKHPFSEFSATCLIQRKKNDNEAKLCNTHLVTVVKFFGLQSKQSCYRDKMGVTQLGLIVVFQIKTKMPKICGEKMSAIVHCLIQDYFKKSCWQLILSDIWIDSLTRINGLLHN